MSELQVTKAKLNKATGRVALLAYLRLARPKQWTKNLFVFAALFFSGHLLELAYVKTACLAFISFSLISSSVYVLNDLMDIEKDRLHPTKRFRPLAAGLLRVPEAIGFGLLLFAAAVVLAITLQSAVLYLVVTYFAVNLLYSSKLKHIVLVDVFMIALGFVLRVMAGAYALAVTPSPWLLLCTFLLALFLALCKRRAEGKVLADGAGAHRKILEEYNPAFLDQLISMLSAVTIMAYAMYTFNSPTGTVMMYTIPFVIYAIFRYLYLVYKQDRGEEPASILIGDKPFIANCLIWLLVTFLLIYIK